MPVLKIWVCSFKDVANITTMGATQAIAKKIKAA
jgi:hypothetical protein